jgi:four helix bundle protein
LGHGWRLCHLGPVRDFGRLIVWREATSLAATVLEAGAKIRGPARANVVSQMVRSSESIAANLVEGLGRGVSRDCIRFLTIARSSAQELDHHLRQARISKRLSTDLADDLLGHTRRVRFLLRRLQESVERRLNGDPPS